MAETEHEVVTVVVALSGEVTAGTKQSAFEVVVTVDGSAADETERETVFE